MPRETMRWRQSSVHLGGLLAVTAVNCSHALALAISRLARQSRRTSPHFQHATGDRLFAPASISQNESAYTAALKFGLGSNCW